MYTAPGVAWLARLDREPAPSERERITAAENYAMAPAADSLDAFKRLIMRLSVPFDTWRQVARRTVQADEGLRAAFEGWPLLGTSVVGSVVRSTVLRPVHDVDLMVVFQQVPGLGLTTLSPEDFLSLISEQISGLAPAAKVWSGECVRLSFGDPPDIDVFAGYTLGPGNVVNFPKVGSAWYRTNPVAVDQAIIDANKRLGGRLLPLLLLLKCWSERAGKHCPSFHLELLVARFYGSLGRPLPVHVYEFLEAGATQGEKFLSVPTPCGFVTDLSQAMTPASKQAMAEAFSAGASIAKSALTAMAAGDDRTAVRQWTELFGPVFPHLEVP